MPSNPALAAFATNLSRIAVPERIAAQPIEGVYTVHASSESFSVPTVYEPSVCLLAQGAKQVMLGNEVLRYRAGQCLVASFDLPVKGSVIGATPAEPYLCLVLNIDPDLLYELFPFVPGTDDVKAPPHLGISVHDAEDALVENAAKLCAVLAHPDSIPVLAPLVIREIHYRLLSGPQGKTLRQLVSKGANAQRIAKVIAYLKDHFARRVDIAYLAKLARMSESSLHAHFKAATSMSPLQFQKQLRLLEARRRLVVDGADASDTAYGVGYESISQFSREYSRMFGLPPVKDARRVREHSGTWYGS